MQKVWIADDRLGSFTTDAISASIARCPLRFISDGRPQECGLS
jgi:hypothetical protein